MFTIGEFSRFAQVTTDLLRHYDRLDLFKPIYTDPITGYRYYQIEQLTDLNRVLALKELGLSLEQIRRLLHDHISTDEIRGMLTLQRLKSEAIVQLEQQRLQRIESRLNYLDSNGKLPQFDIITKSTDQQFWLSIAKRDHPALSSEAFFYEVHRAFSQHYPKHTGPCLCVINELALETDDWRMGYITDRQATDQLALTERFTLHCGHLAGHAVVAAVSFTGSMAELFRAYSVLGQWVDANRVQVVGKTIELFFQVDPANRNHTAEIQMPLSA